jgi:hypothetical protein
MRIAVPGGGNARLPPPAILRSPVTMFASGAAITQPSPPTRERWLHLGRTFAANTKPRQR